MNRQRTIQILYLTLLAVSCGGPAVGAGELGITDFGPTPPPLAYPVAVQLSNNPALLSAAKAQWPRGSSQLAPLGTPGTAAPAGGTWTAGTSPGVHLMNPLLLTDGTVIAMTSCTGNWYKLTPTNTGSYINGTWTQIASMPSGYAPRFEGSAVLTDGKVVVEGGEYNNTGSGCNAVWTNKGAIYDPAANIWTAITPPSGWTELGDAQAIVLTNGTYMQANCCEKINGVFGAALLTESNLTWTPTGTGKFDRYDEEGWTLLPSGNVLTVDAYTGTGTCGQNSEIYNASNGTWSSAGNTGVQLADCSNPGGKPSFELGPQVLRPDGTVVAFGGTTCSDVANASCANGSLSVTTMTAIFNSANNSWSTGPAIPAVSGLNYTLPDAPAALEPNGTILFAASPNYQYAIKPVHFFEFSPANAITQVADNSTNDTVNFTSYEYDFLVLPSGQIMAVQTDGPNVWYYTPAGGPCSGCAPAITSLSSTTLTPGQTYTATGTQLNGLSQAVGYGDDIQGATNYPIIAIVNSSTQHVFGAKSFGYTTTSVAPNQVSTASFTVPGNIETGASTLIAFANGIPSAPVAVTVGNSGNNTLSVSLLGPGTVTSSPAGINCPTTCSANFASGTQVTLSQSPASGWNFLEWDGACLGNGGCIATMNANQNVMATFWTDISSATVPKAGVAPASPMP